MSTPERANATASSRGTVVPGPPPLTPAFHVNLESVRRTIVHGDALTLIVGYATDPPVCRSYAGPEFRARRHGELYFQPVELRRLDSSVSSPDSFAVFWEAAPTVTTTCRAVWHGAMSGDLVVGVWPAVSLRRQGPRIRLAVGAERSYAGRVVRAEARQARGWRFAARVRLGADGTATFHAPRTTAVRVWVPATAGYLAATRTLRLSA